MAILALDGPNTSATTRASFQSHDHEFNLSFKEIMENIRLLLIIFEANIKNTFNICWKMSMTEHYIFRISNLF